MTIKSLNDNSIFLTKNSACSIALGNQSIRRKVFCCSAILMAISIRSYVMKCSIISPWFIVSFRWFHMKLLLEWNDLRISHISKYLWFGKDLINKSACVHLPHHWIPNRIMSLFIFLKIKKINLTFRIRLYIMIRFGISNSLTNGMVDWKSFYALTLIIL